MPITIVLPAAAVSAKVHNRTNAEINAFDLDNDVSVEEATGGSAKSIVTPGATVTNDPQWMRYARRTVPITQYDIGHGTYVPEGSTGIISTLAGTVLKTNKLLSVTALRARYMPEIGDLVVGRIIEVQSRRWRVDISAPQLASLPLSAINLPGGILRKRTAVDELNIRTFFTEGDLLVAEVQTIHQTGFASLHTRSLKYGKLRNGYFLSVSGTGGNGGRQGGVARSRRQVFTLSTSRGEKVSIVLGVNGYIWISKHVEPPSAGGEVRITRIEESLSKEVYSSQNDEIDFKMRREIARVTGVIRMLVQSGMRIDEDTILKGYDTTTELEFEQTGNENRACGSLRGEAGRRSADVAYSIV